MPADSSKGLIPFKTNRGSFETESPAERRDSLSAGELESSACSIIP